MSRLRLAEPADRAAILSLAVDFYAEDGFTTPREKLAEHLAHLLVSAAAHAAVIEEDGEVVAFAISTSSYGLESGLIAELEDLYVAPAHRRRGLAGELIGTSRRSTATSAPTAPERAHPRRRCAADHSRAGKLAALAGGQSRAASHAKGIVDCESVEGTKNVLARLGGAEMPRALDHGQRRVGPRTV